MPSMEAPKKKRQQKRGRERRMHILRAARELLIEKDLNEISLADVAGRTGVPLSSLYHFYPNLQKLLTEMVPVFTTELIEFYRQAFRSVEGDTWKFYFDRIIDATTEFYEKNPGYRQLILSGKAPDQIKRADRRLDEILVKAITVRIEERFDFPEIPELNEAFSYALQIIELALSLSVIRNGTITPAAIAEGKRAGYAYLRTYLPEDIPLRGDSQAARQDLEPD